MIVLPPRNKVIYDVPREIMQNQATDRWKRGKVLIGRGGGLLSLSEWLKVISIISALTDASNPYTIICLNSLKFDPSAMKES